MSQDIELYNRIQNPIEAIEKLGTMFAKSGMFGCDRLEQGMILAWTCLAERKTPLEVKRRHHLHNGELSTRADAMLADFRTIKKGTHKVLARNADRATVELTLEGQTLTFEFTWEEALKEPFIYGKENKIKKNYATPRARMQMLWARVISDGVRTMAPEIVSGTYTPEELDDDAPERPAAELLPSQPAPQEPKPAKVTNVETVAPQAAATAPAQPAEVVNEMPAAAKPVVNNWTAADGKSLSNEAAMALDELIPADRQQAALRWMEAKQWIPPMGSLKNLSPARGRKVYDNIEKFLEDIAKG